MSIKVLYRTSAMAIGGREGLARSDDGRLEVNLSSPTELGGAGGAGTDPEHIRAQPPVGLTPGL